MAISEGIGYAPLVNARNFKQDTASFLGVEQSIKKYDDAIQLSINQLTDLKASNPEQGEVLSAHILLLKDPNLRFEVVENIKTEHCDPKTAFTAVVGRYIELFLQVNDEYLRQRYVDFLDIKERVVNNLSNQKISFSNLEKCILVVDELFPSSLINISKNVQGIIAAKGGFTSHSAILCRSLGLPYVIAEVPADYQDMLLIHKDQVILNPAESTIQNYLNEKKQPLVVPAKMHGISLWANVSSNNEIENVGDSFAGIGLYRTEFLLSSQPQAMNEGYQALIYKDALKRMKGRPIIFRTFDIGGDKSVDYLPLGKKGVQNYYRYPKFFETQVEALLEAARSYSDQVYIMFPMIESFAQYQELKKYIWKKARFNHQRCPKIGMMLETQMALSNLESFQKVDFISVGTNDLCEELFNMSRDRIVFYDEIYEVLGITMEKIISFCKAKRIKLSVCGELASKKDFAKRLFQLGLKNVSISPMQVRSIYEAISEVEEC